MARITAILQMLKDLDRVDAEIRYGYCYCVDECSCTGSISEVSNPNGDYIRYYDLHPIIDALEALKNGS